MVDVLIARRGSQAIPAPRPVVLTGVLEVRSAEDGRLDVVVEAAGERIRLDYPPGLAAAVRAGILREVSAGGILCRTGECTVVHLAWLHFSVS
ncbi:hypothetical protein [Amycolatopsis sp. NPDC051903]|uniref:hypothetical protein n=1 Tax=Amycolatopsis sp. NPDC051903 TaxID=3363936 RepID=UPI0037A5AF3A